MGRSAQTTERLGLGWVLVSPAEGAPYYAQLRTQKTQYDEPRELRELRQLSLDLVRAAEAGGAEDIDKLLVQGAALNAPDAAGVTPVMKAAMFGNTRALVRLLEEGPDLSCRDTKHGRTPLLWAVVYGQCVGDSLGGCVGMLIRAGANPEDVDSAGQRAMDLCCLALEAEVRTERQHVMQRLLSVLNIWSKVCDCNNAIAKLVRHGNFVVALQKVSETLTAVADMLAVSHLSKRERTDFEVLQHTMQGWRTRCEFGAKRRAVEQQLAKLTILPARTLDEVTGTLAQADEALLAYEKLSEECHDWSTNSEENWRDVEAAGVAAGLEQCEKLRILLRRDCLRLEKEHAAELKSLALEETRARRATRETAVEDAKQQAEAERVPQETANRERKERNERGVLGDFQGNIKNPKVASASARRLQVKRQQRLKELHSRFSVSEVEVATRIAGEITVKHIEHERDRIVYAVALAIEDIDETNRLREDLVWQSSSDEWHCAVELSVAATEKYESALAVLLKTPSALSKNAADELKDAVEAAHELADVLEEEAQSAEDVHLAHHSAMAAAQIGGSSGTYALVCGAEKEAEQQQLDGMPKPLLQPKDRVSNPWEPMRFGVARKTFESPSLGAQLRVKIKQRQAEHETTAQNEAILRAQKSARRRIVQEVHRVAAVNQLVRIADGGQVFRQSQFASSGFGDSIVSTSTAPAWIDDANGKPDGPAIRFISPRQIKLQTESEYSKQQPAVAASTSKDESVNRPAYKGTQQPVRIGIQDTCSTRSFPTMLPPNLPAALYLTMQQREADRAAKEEERRAREHGWRASMQVDPTPPEKRIYMCGDMVIQVGGRGSKIVDATVSEMKSKKLQQAKGREQTIEYATQTARVWKDSGSKVATGRANAPRMEQRGMATDSVLDR